MTHRPNVVMRLLGRLIRPLVDEALRTEGGLQAHVRILAAPHPDLIAGLAGLNDQLDASRGDPRGELAPRELDSCIEIDRAALKLIEQLGGLRISQARAVLKAAQGWLECTHRVDLNAPDYREATGEAADERE